MVEIESRGTDSISAEKKNIYILPASVIKRFFAFVIDLFIINIFILGPFSSLFDSVAQSSAGFGTTYELILSSPELRASLSTALFFITILILLYFIVLQRKFNQTVGMMVMNVFVVKISSFPLEGNSMRKKKKINSNSLKLGFFDALLRNLFVIPFAPFIFLWLIDPIYLFFNKNSQRLMEVFSRTLVVEIIDYDSVRNQKRWL